MSLHYCWLIWMQQIAFFGLQTIITGQMMGAGEKMIGIIAVEPCKRIIGVFRKLLLLVLTMLTFCDLVAAVTREECFNISSLDPSLEERAEQYLLKALDSEALYTIVGGLKPLSMGFVSFLYPSGSIPLEVSQANSIFSAFKCGEMEAFVHESALVSNDKRYASAAIAVYSGPRF